MTSQISRLNRTIFNFAPNKKFSIIPFLRYRRLNNKLHFFVQGTHFVYSYLKRYYNREDNNILRENNTSESSVLTLMIRIETGLVFCFKQNMFYFWFAILAEQIVSYIV
jgi:hypothetical protein